MKSEKLSKDKCKDNHISNANLKNIKSNYILSKINANLLKKNSLNITKYNKKIQKRLNICLKDYIEYSELFSSIEIIIIPSKGKYDKFIKVNEDKKLFFKIYFNDNNEEIKRNSLYFNENVKKIKIIIDYQINSFEGLFEFNGYDCIEYINFKKFYRTNITNMVGMFNGCSKLKELHLSNFNTSNVTNMESMFQGCSSLKEINLSNFNTNNVKIMK